MSAREHTTNTVGENDKSFFLACNKRTADNKTQWEKVSERDAGGQFDCSIELFTRNNIGKPKKNENEKKKKQNGINSTLNINNYLSVHGHSR